MPSTFHVFDAVSFDEFHRLLPLVDAVHLATTCHHFVFLFHSVFTSGGRIDFGRLKDEETHRESDAFFQSVLFQATSLVSVTSINIENCDSLTNEAIMAIAANCPALKTSRTKRSRPSPRIVHLLRSSTSCAAP